MNKTELRYALNLEQRKLLGEVQWFQFEAMRLQLADRTTYTPDFVVMLQDDIIEFHEVKGCSKKGTPRVESTSSVKIKIASEKYPFRFRMVWFHQNEWKERVYE